MGRGETLHVALALHVNNNMPKTLLKNTSLLQEPVDVHVQLLEGWQHVPMVTTSGMATYPHGNY